MQLEVAQRSADKFPEFIKLNVEELDDTTNAMTLAAITGAALSGGKLTLDIVTGVSSHRALAERGGGSSDGVKAPDCLPANVLSLFAWRDGPDSEGATVGFRGARGGRENTQGLSSTAMAIGAAAILMLRKLEQSVHKEGESQGISMRIEDIEELLETQPELKQLVTVDVVFA